MKAKKLVFGDDVRKGLAAGIDKVAQVASKTLGPKAGLVLIAREYGPGEITKDGITAIKDIVLEDHVENQGARLVISVSSKTAEAAGDGTTSSCVVANAMVQEGIKYVSSGGNASDVKKGIDLAVEKVVEYIQENAVGVKDRQSVKYIASIAGNSEEIGEYIAKAADAIGLDGIITLEESQNNETSVDIVDGMQFDRGFLSQHFVNVTEKNCVEFDDAIILLHEGKLQNQVLAADFLNKVVPLGKPIVIIAEDVEQDVLAMLTLNKIRGNIPVCALRTPGYGANRKNILEDIAVLTGATVISDSTGLNLQSATIEDCGSVKKITIEKESTILIQGAGEKTGILNRIAQLKLEQSQVQSNYDKDQLQKRLSALSGGVAVIKVGAASETEIKERLARFDDGVQATRSAVAEGMVVGGGVTLFRASESLNNFTHENYGINIGIKIVKDALKAPLITIADNAGVKGEVIASQVASAEGNFGYNASTDTMEDLFVAGIVDAAKVSRNVVQNAASIASLVLMCQCLVGMEPEEDNDPMRF